MKFKDYFVWYLLFFLFKTSFSQNILPNQIPNIILWLDASNGVQQIANSVSQWNDQSGNSFHLTQSTLSARPVLTNSESTLNNKPVVKFDGTNDFMSVDFGQSFVAPNTYFLIHNNVRGGGAVGGIFDGLIDASRNTFFWGTSGGIGRLIAQTVPSTSFRYNKTQPYDYILNTIVFNGSSSSIFENGLQMLSGTLSDQPISGFQIGRKTSGGINYLNGNIAEVIFYNRVLTTEERIQVEKYLMDKYAPPVNLGEDINDVYGFENITLSSTGYFTNYSWTGETTASTATVSINNPGQYILTGTDIFGRVSKDTINVTRPDYASIQLSNQTICYNGNTSITAPMPAGDYTFVQWSDGVTTQTRTISQTASLSYTIKDNANFTRTSNVATFTFDNTLQNVSLGNDLNLCVGNSIALTQTHPSITSYLWDNGSTTPSILLTNSGEYFVEVTNSNGCVKKDTIQVTIIGQAPTIQLSFPNQFCQNESASFSESSFVQSGEAIASRIWNFGNNTNSSLSNGTFSDNIVGTYNGTLTVNSVSGCQSTLPFSYNIRPKPLANYTSPLLCDNVTGLFTNTSTAPSSTITASQWLVNDVVNASTTNLNYAHPTIGSYNLKLVVTNGFGCSDTSSQTQSVINTYPIPNAPSLIDPFNTKTVLSTEQIPFSWSSVANNYLYELQFSTTNNFSSIISNQSTTLTSLTTTTNTGGTIFWRVKANNPCLLGGTSQVFSVQSVTIADSLRLWLRADRGVTLNGSSVSSWVDQSSNNLNASQSTVANQPTFIATNPIINGLSSLRFDGTNDLLNGSLIPRFGNNSLSVFAVASGGNQSTTNAVLLSSGSSTTGWWLSRRASVGRIGVLHNNNTLQGATTTLPTSGYNFRLFGYNKVFGSSALLKVNGNNEISSTTATAINGFTNANYQIGAGSGANFLNGDIAEVMVFTKTLSTQEQAGIEKYLMDKYSKPVNLGSDITSNYGFCDFNLTSNAFFQSYVWSTGATTSSISINEPGIYWVQATDVFGRVSTDSVVLTRPHYSQIQVNNQIICYNNPQTINATIPAGDYTFVQWNDGLTIPSRLQGQAQSLFYTLKDNQNCTKLSDTAIITIDNSLQAVRLGNDTNLCVGNTIQLAVTGPSITTYSWNTGNTNPSQVIDTSGAYILTVTNANGCVQLDTINITVLGNAPVLAFAVPSTVCLGSSLSYTDSSSVVGATISSVLWNFGNGQTATQSTGQFDYSQVGDYMGSLLVQSNNGCSSSSNFPVSVKSLPIANFTVPLLCSNTPATITNTSTIAINGGAINSQIWNVDNVQAAITNNLTYSFLTAGSYEVALIVENQFGCRDTSIQQVNTASAFAVPVSSTLISPSNDFTTLVNEPINLVWNAVANNYFYTVEVSSNQNFSTIDYTTTTTSPNLSYTPTMSGSYYWRVKTNNACLQGVISAVRLFTATTISSSTLWLRGDAGVTTVSNSVSQWNDQSGNGFHLTQSTLSARPVLTNSVSTLNNKPVVKFDGTNDFMSVDFGQSFVAPNTYLLIHNNIRGGTAVGGIFDGLIDTSRNTFFWGTSGGIGRLIAQTIPSTSFRYNKTQPYDYILNTIVFNGSSSSIFENGLQMLSGTLSDQPISGFQIGRKTSGGINYLNGNIAEVIFYNRVLTTEERIQVEKYLMDKYAPPVNLGADILSNYGFCDTVLVSKGYYTSYLWSNGATSSTLTVNQPGTYWLTATDIFGRVSSDTLQLIRPVYDSISLQNQIVCFNNLINETAFVPTGYSFVNWNDGDTNQTRLLNQNELLSYTVADTSNCQLTSNSVSIVIDSSLFDISLGADTNLCVGNTIELQQTNSFITSYLWNTGNSNPIQTLDTAGVYILDVQNQNNCFNRDSIEITIDGFSPEIIFNFPIENCQFSEVLFSETSTVQGSTIESTSWTIGNQTPILNSNGQITFNQPGIVPVQLEVVSAQNCRSIDTFTITVHTKPIVNFTTVNYCPYQDIVFNSTNLASSQLINYDWNFGQSSSSSNTSQQENPSHFYGLEGTYSVNLKVIDEHGCKDTLIQDVLIQPAPISNFSVQNTCENTLVEFTNISSIPSGYSITSNLWNYGDNTTTINPTIGKEYAAYGDYVIELITIGNNGCSDTSNQSVTIYSNPILNWNISPSCKNTLTVFEDLSTIPEGTLVSTDWLVNLQYPFTTPIASYRFATLGEQYLNLTSTSDQNCTSDTLILVNVNPELNANFSYSPTIVVAGVPVTFTDLSIGSTTATWDLGIGEELITYTPPVTQFAKIYPLEWVDSTVDLTLFVENQIGCKDTITKSFGVQGPAFDLEVKSLFIQEINGFNTVGVEFENVGTISINKIDFELSGLNTLPIQETWNGTLLPNQDQIYMFNAKLSAYNSTQDELSNFLCVEGIASDILGNVDVIKENNKVCENTENEELALLSVAPNPTDNLTNVSLLIPSKTDVTILNVSLYSMNGSIVQYVIKDQSLEAGIFDFNVDLTNVQRGIYLLKIEDGTTTKVIRLSKI
jgi:PKD repeat protein